jgi:hypothetical protein
MRQRKLDAMRLGVWVRSRKLTTKSSHLIILLAQLIHIWRASGQWFAAQQAGLIKILNI